MMNKITHISTLALTLAPSLALAQVVDTTSGALDTIEENITVPLEGIVNSLIPIVIGLLIVAFFWGMAKYVFAQGDETKKADGKKIMLYGAIAMFVAFSIWGIISILQDTFGITDDATTFTGDSVIPDLAPGS